MELKKLNINDIIEKEKVKNFVDNINSVDVKQTIEWYELRKEEKIFIYLEDDDGTIVSSYNAFILHNSKSNYNILYLPRGPVFNDKYIDFKESIKYIVEYAKKNNFKYIRLNPNIKKENLNYEELIKSGYKINVTKENDYNNQREPYREAILNLKNKNSDEILNKLNQKTRYNIRKSIKNDFEVNVADKFDLNAFYNLYLQTAERHDFTPHPISYFEELIEIFKDKIVFCTIKYKNEYLAISINIKQSNTLFYLYGSSNNKYKNLFASYKMHWSMINYAIKNKFEYYNFGGIFTDDDDIDNKDYGLLVFKLKFCYDGFTNYNPEAIIEV